MISFLSVCLLTPDVTPEKTIQTFLTAINARDAAILGRQVLGSRTNLPPFNLGIQAMKATFGAAKIEGNEATIDVDSEIVAARRSSKFHETVHLRRIDSDWQIVPPERFAASTEPHPISIIAFWTTKPELLGMAKTASKKTIDLSKVKQVALAVLMYSADHGDRLPTASNFKASISPYLRSLDVLTAPDAPKGTVSYFLDPRLSGRVLTSMSCPADTAMILEGTPAKTAFPWEGKTPLGYVDGHAKMVEASIVYKARRIGLR